jgi:protocatechuate 3,4-dioxygenase beta subunit
MLLRNSLWVCASMILAVLALHLPAGLADDAPATQPTGSIIVNVIDQDSKPVAGVTVSLVKPGQGHHHDPTSQPSQAPTETPHQHPAPIAQGETDANGSYTFTNIPDGRYGVQALLKHVGHGHARVELTGDSATVTITLAPPKSEQQQQPQTQP